MLKKLQLKKHALTAISYMLPLVVASGLLIAIGNLTGGQVVKDVDELTIPSALTSLGVLGMGLLPSFIAGYIAYSIADRPGIAPGFLMGQIASFLGAGFLGGMIGGYLVGYICLMIENYVKVPKWAEALMPMMIIPTVSAIVGGLLMYFVLGTPITWLTQALTSFINGLDQNAKVAYGFIIGWLGCLDYGGPISKVPNLICDGLMLEGVYGPEGIKVLAAMVPPFAVAIALLLSKFVGKPIFKKTEQDNIGIAFPMGVCMISEGVIPIAMNDIIRTVFSTSIGCGICGAIAFASGVESMVPSGGVFVIPAMTNPIMAVVALLCGSAVSALLLVLVKKRLDPHEINDLEEPDADEQEVDLSSFSLS
ncbi:PTS system unknown substrate IIC component, Fru family [Coriobacterium glomerans PW2]|uniref:PTS EIIC type-2 domain-containing protein n=1 Tax=Coriobacterium glomerans (strain ATCC 49209 / DSM 20642 / JCM 10262 / PW2) TaxID=700015 RepID=F2NAX9_CORGP|nr:PTS fructose transporter subunit IIC [Coriobacterium glomerans]AEB07657.1 PTS system unknown substrate IIC component, Fru family [Coriobacterium glomerans PW2]